MTKQKVRVSAHHLGIHSLHSRGVEGVVKDLQGYSMFYGHVRPYGMTSVAIDDARAWAIARGYEIVE